MSGARRGPKPQPTALRVIDGRRANPKSDSATEPQPEIEPTLPKPPDYLRRYAKDEWKRLMPDLWKTGVFTRVDVSIFAAYCMAYHRWRIAEKQLADNKMTETTSNGNAVQNPLVGIASSARKDMLRLGTEFGLTPSSRTYLSSGATTPETPNGGKYNF